MAIEYFDKHLDLLSLALKPETRLIVLEGTTKSSKTTMAIQAFFLRVYNSKSTYHMIASNDYDTMERNILNAEDIGLLKAFPKQCSLEKDKIAGYYVKVKSPVGEKKIILVGYSNKAKWKKALGGDIECVMIDEVNIADETFINELFTRQSSMINAFTIFTLNGDRPDHKIYTHYINECIPLGNIPTSILIDMNKFPKKKNRYYTHWNFNDNPAMSVEMIEEAMNLFPIGSYYHTTKLLGERGSPGKMIYVDYLDYTKHLKSFEHNQFNEYVIGVDIGQNRAYNSFACVGFSADKTRVGLYSHYAFQQVGYEQKKQYLIAYVRNLLSKGLYIKAISVDSAEQNFIFDLKAEFQRLGLPEVISSYKATIKDRIDLAIILLSAFRFIFNNTQEGKEVYNAFMSAKWVEGKEGVEREDKNEKHIDILDSVEYALTVYMKTILASLRMKGVA